MDLASLGLDDKEHQVPDSPKDSQGFNGKEVTCVEGLPMGVHERGPGAPLVTLGRGDHACFIEDVGDGTSADVDAGPSPHPGWHRQSVLPYQ